MEQLGTCQDAKEDQDIKVQHSQTEEKLKQQEEERQKKHNRQYFYYFIHVQTTCSFCIVSVLLISNRCARHVI